ncbi:MAG: DUF1294 domain-containing protein [Evtepia sp.]
MYGRYFILYLIAVNFLAFFLMAYDKSQARKGRWRIAEKTLFLTAAIGGSVGAIAGMKIFRHKTRHRSFQYGMPIILFVQILLAILVFLLSPL